MNADPEMHPHSGVAKNKDYHVLDNMHGILRSTMIQVNIVDQVSTHEHGFRSMASFFGHAIIMAYPY